MNYYSFNDIAETHDISKETLKRRCLSDELEYIKIPTSRHNDKIFRYCIPETELAKLAPLKKSEIKINPLSQPDYYINLWAEQDKERQRRQEAYERWLKERERRRSYEEYLKTPEWLAKKQQAKARDKYICRICGSGMNLEVHHTSYDNLGKPEELDDLVTLCRGCHERVHHEDLRRRIAGD